MSLAADRSAVAFAVRFGLRPIGPPDSQSDRSRLTARARETSVKTFGAPLVARTAGAVALATCLRSGPRPSPVSYRADQRPDVVRLQGNVGFVLWARTSRAPAETSCPNRAFSSAGAMAVLPRTQFVAPTPHSASRIGLLHRCDLRFRRQFLGTRSGRYRPPAPAHRLCPL